jgi:AcrR family transcriptional regulator
MARAPKPRRASADHTRARIFASAVRLFAEQGYEGTSVDRIVRDAGVAKGTFFIHFATKEAVVTQLVRLTSGGSPVDALRATVMSLGEQAGANRGLSRAIVTANIVSSELGSHAESVFDGIVVEMMDDVRTAQRAGLLSKNSDAETIAGTLVTSYLGATLHFATSPRPAPLVALLSPVVEANLIGFGARPQRAAKPPRKAWAPARRKTGGT